MCTTHSTSYVSDDTVRNQRDRVSSVRCQTDRPWIPIEERRASGTCLCRCVDGKHQLPCKAARALKHEATWERLLVRTTPRAEHQQGGVAVDPDRIQNESGLLGPLTKTDVTLRKAPWHLVALPRQPPPCPAGRTTRQREQRQRSS